MALTVTVRQLRLLNACQEQIEMFKKTFGDSVVVTEKLCVEHFDKFDPARAEYGRIADSARAKYERIQAATFGKLAEKL